MQDKFVWGVAGPLVFDSPEVIFMKLTRLGVAIPQKSSVEKSVNKVTEQPTTTTPMPKLEIAKLEELPSGNEAIGDTRSPDAFVARTVVTNYSLVRNHNSSSPIHQ